MKKRDILISQCFFVKGHEERENLKSQCFFAKSHQKVKFLFLLRKVSKLNLSKIIN